MRATEPGFRAQRAPDRIIGRARHHGGRTPARSACPWRDRPAGWARHSRPACRCRCVSRMSAVHPATSPRRRLVEQFRVEPAHHAAPPPLLRPQGLVGVVGEVQVMGLEAGIDERYFIVLGSSIASARCVSLSGKQPWPRDDPSLSCRNRISPVRAPPPPARHGLYGRSSNCGC